MDRFFDGTFLTFGIEVISFAERDQEDRIDPMVSIRSQMVIISYHMVIILSQMISTFSHMVSILDTITERN